MELATITLACARATLDSRCDFFGVWNMFQDDNCGVEVITITPAHKCGSDLLLDGYRISDQPNLVTRTNIVLATVLACSIAVNTILALVMSKIQDTAR